LWNYAEYNERIDDYEKLVDFYHTEEHLAKAAEALFGNAGMRSIVPNSLNRMVAQSIMRHSDINLTMSIYTHTVRGQESEAVAKLPDLSTPSKQQKLGLERA